MALHQTIDLKAAAAFAESLADAAGPIARRYFRSALEVEDKADRSPVTVADREIESRLRALIRSRFPEHGILGEEHGSEGAGRDLVWVLDPIDGTKSFVAGVPLFGTLIALLDRGHPVLGVIDHPALGERWVGAAGSATLWNGKPCRTRRCGGLGRAILFATSPDLFDGADRDRFEAVSRRARMRRYGADCYAYALLAGGCIDAVLEANLKPYDIMALIPVIEGAGGTITDWRGERLGPESDGRVVAAATPELHGEILELLTA